ADKRAARREDTQQRRCTRTSNLAIQVIMPCRAWRANAFHFNWAFRFFTDVGTISIWTTS
ncbi:MAG TPA: hypothetical protein VJU53_05140, partial [Burkholderiaceae bacterium]|nr:hypothetical protein [Burkholderiaceae bacterium]